MQSFIAMLKLIGTTATAQLSGPKAWLASIVIKIVIFFLDYLKIKHELKKQFDEKLKDFEKTSADPTATEKQKDEALDNFLK